MGDGAEHVCDSVDDLVDEHLAELEIIAMVARSMMTASLSINDHVSLCWARRMTGSGRSMNGAETTVGYINNLAVSTTHCRTGSCVSAHRHADERVDDGGRVGDGHIRLYKIITSI